MQDTIFFNDEGVLVTRSRIVVLDQTFAMSGITSVKVAPLHHIFRRIVAVVFILFGLMMCIPGNASAYVVAALSVVVGVAIAWGAKTRYALILLSASGELKALVDTNEDLVYKISTSISNAMIARG
jgi:hypothetical protein